ncbi:MAG: hypothetical protein QXP68_07435 [Thermosphaera sp.]
MKLVSETFSTVLITSVLLALLGVLSFYTFISMAGFNTTTEYLYYRQAFLSIGNSLVIPMMGGSYEISIPMHQQSIGYSKVGEIIFYFNNSATPSQILECIGLVSGVRGYSRSNSTIYGSNSYIVNDSRLIARVLETYNSGESRLYLDTCRLWVESEVTRSSSGILFFYRIFYYNLTVKMQYGERARGLIRVSMTGSPITYYGYAQNMTIRFSDRIHGRDIVASTSNLSSTPPGTPLIYILTIYNVEIEVK